MLTRKQFSEKIWHAPGEWGAADKWAKVQRKLSDGRRDVTVTHGQGLQSGLSQTRWPCQQPTLWEVLDTSANKTPCQLLPP